MSDLSEAPGDELPEDLQPHLVDPDDYIFPNNNRRRVPGYLYLVIAAVLVAVVAIFGDRLFVNEGLLGAAIVLAVVGTYSIVSGWNLDIDERDALIASSAEVGFPVGHAAAQMGWRGLLSRPTWKILLYSADEPPTKRAFVMVDGVDGSIVESFVEDNPEDWSDTTLYEPTAAGDQAEKTDAVDDSAEDTAESSEDDAVADAVHDSTDDPDTGAEDRAGREGA